MYDIQKPTITSIVMRGVLVGGAADAQPIKCLGPLPHIALPNLRNVRTLHAATVQSVFEG